PLAAIRNLGSHLALRWWGFQGYPISQPGCCPSLTAPLSAQLGHAKPTTTLTYYAHWIPSGDKRHIDRLEAIRTAAEVADGSKAVAAADGDDSKVCDNKWSRGRELNPRPTDYEALWADFRRSRCVADGSVQSYRCSRYTEDSDRAGRVIKIDDCGPSPT